MKNGRLIILSGPSGSGKTTLHKALLQSAALKGKLVKSVSVTTRPKRLGERHGRDYFFMSREQFLGKKKSGHFLESQRVFQHYYGTPQHNVLDLLKRGKHVLLCIDVKGARVVRRKHPAALTIFIKAPSLAVLKKRLQSRGTEDAQTLKLRLHTAQQELIEAKDYDYVVVNDALSRTQRALEDILFHELELNSRRGSGD